MSLGQDSANVKQPINIFRTKAVLKILYLWIIWIICAWLMCTVCVWLFKSLIPLLVEARSQ